MLIQGANFLCLFSTNSFLKSGIGQKRLTGESETIFSSKFQNCSYNKACWNPRPSQNYELIQQIIVNNDKASPSTCSDENHWPSGRQFFCFFPPSLFSLLFQEFDQDEPIDNSEWKQVWLKVVGFLFTNSYFSKTILMSFWLLIEIFSIWINKLSCG